MTSIDSPPAQPPLRWWPAALILALATAVLVWVWGFEDVHRQDKNLQSIGAGVMTLLLLLLWTLFLSRLPWRIRLGIAGGVVGIVAVCAALFEIKGVTGDLIPVLGWRWADSPAAAAPVAAPPPPATPAAAVVPSPFAPEHDYPQFLGPNRTGKVQGPRLARNWKEQPPQELWRKPLGAAWSGFAVAGQFAATMEQQGENEAITCYDLRTGRLFWSRAYPAHFKTTIAGEGPRTVPTIAGGRVYALGATGILTCLNLADGQILWTKDIIQDSHSKVPSWGVSCAPLVLDEMVVVCAGGPKGRSLVSYHAATGQRVWGGGDDQANFSSPVLCHLAGVRQILMFNEIGVSAHDAGSGEVLWKYPWRRGHPHVTNPLSLPGDRVLVSSGYGTGSELLQVKRDDQGTWSVARLWKSIRLKSKFANLIERDGYVYGLDDGILVCLGLERGDLRWKEGRYGHGQMILADDLLLVMAETGEVVLLEPDPKEHRELARFTAFSDKTWNPPALAGRYLLVRNDQEGACYRLPVLLEN